jgi:hypothetical protein
MVAQVLRMKLNGSDVANVSGYMKDVLRAHDGQAMKYQCKAGSSVISRLQLRRGCCNNFKAFTLKTAKT